MMKYVYIAFCDEIIFRTFFGHFSDRQTDWQTDIVIHREVTLPKRNKNFRKFKVYNWDILEFRSQNFKLVPFDF